MTSSVLKRAVLVAAAFSLLPPASASADTPGDLRDLIGIRGSSSDGEMARRGYTLAKSTDDVSYWWNASRRSCVSIEIDDGRVSGINGETDRQCGKSGGNGAAAAALGAVLIGALVAGAAASDKHRQHDDGGDDYRDRGDHHGFVFSPADGINCYPRQSACFDDGSFSSYWTHREF